MIFIYYILLAILFLVAIIEFVWYVRLQISSSYNRKPNYNLDPNNYYSKKSFMTPTELKFYNKIKVLESSYNIIPQINLATIINKNSTTTKKTFQNELYRNIDFAIFTKDYSRVLLLIELNDSTHDKRIRKYRDRKVKSICDKAGIKLISFYTVYPNEQQYVINRILKEVNNQNI